MRETTGVNSATRLPTAKENSWHKGTAAELKKSLISSSSRFAVPYTLTLLVQRMSWPIFFILFCFFLRLRVVGEENIRTLAPPVIFTPNHKSYIDHFIIHAAMPFSPPFTTVHMMAADWVFEKKLRAALVGAFGSFHAYRGTGIENSLRIPKEVIAKKRAVAIYPEGGMIPEKRILGDPKRGAAILAIETRSPILPIAVLDTHRLTLKDFLLRRRSVTVIFGEPYALPSSLQITDADVAYATTIIMDAVRNIYFSGLQAYYGNSS